MGKDANLNKAQSPGASLTCLYREGEALQEYFYPGEGQEDWGSSGLLLT